MTISRILDGLERSTAAGVEADKAARMGFLQWALSDSAGATPQAARTALEALGPHCPSSPAAQAFVGFLEQATRTIAPNRRRGRKAFH